MKTKTIVGLGIFFILLIGIAFALNYYFEIVPLASSPTSCVGGLSILISQAGHNPGETFYHGEATANNGAECFKIAWTEKDIENYLDEDAEVDDGVFGDIIIDSQGRTFYASVQNQPVESYHTKEISSYTCSNSDCASKIYGEKRIVASNRGGLSKCLCIYTLERGNFALFPNTGERHFDATIYIDGLGSREISEDNIVANFNEKAIFNFQGFLNGIYSIGAPTSYKPFKEGNSYKLTNTNYGSYGSTQITGIGDYPSSYYRLDNFDFCITRAIFWDDVEECVNAHTKKANELLKDRSGDYEDSTGFVKDTSWVGGDFYVDLEPYTVEYPRFSFDIDAEWLGIKYVRGDPKVECPDDTESESGVRLTNVDLKVRNADKDERGLFQVTLDCGTASTSLIKDRVALEENSDWLDITGAIKQTTSEPKLKEKCTFKATTIKTPIKSDTCYFYHTTIGGFECIEGNKKCSDDNNYLLTCGDESTWASGTKKKCDYGCVIDPKEGAMCRGEVCIKEGGVCAVDGDCCEGLLCENRKCVKVDKDCKSCFSWLWNKVKPGHCEVALVFDPPWYNPVGWFVPDINQDSICPIVLVVIGIGLFFLLAIGGIIIFFLVVLIRKRMKK